MNFSSWAATVVASPAIAAGILLVAPAVAQAAPDDAGSSSTESSTADTSTDVASSRSEPQADDDGAERDDDGPNDSDSDSDDSADDGDTEEAVDEPEDDDTDVDDTSVSGPHHVPSSVREFDAGALVSVAVDEDDEDDTVDESDEDSDEDEDANEDEDSDEDGDDNEDDTVDEDDEDANEDEDSDEDGDDTNTDTVQLALDQLAEARRDLYNATWGDGNILAGLAAIVPQMMLGGAQTNLERWMANHARLQDEFAATVDRPFAHAIARIRLENSIRLPIRAGDAMDSAEKLIAVVGWFGPRTATRDIAALVKSAGDNGAVYSILPLQMWYHGNSVKTEPVIYLSVNGGPRVPILLDTGSVGLVIDPRYIGLEDLGTPGETHEGGYGESFKYDFNVYRTSIDFGDGLVIDETDVKVVALYSAAAFAEYNKAGGYVGVLGVGANTSTDWWDTNPLLDLPGRLNEGIMIDERRRRVILGPNPYPARLTLDASPDMPLVVKIGGRAAQRVDGSFDSGGIRGEVPDFLWPDETIPPGTLIEVYTVDGETLIYSYRTTRANRPDISEDSLFNTGFVPFSQDAIYVTFLGNGTTSFNYR
ncbi:PecA family PE domain-processing aspartic protease [Mycobacterium sp. ITM-2016-00317]|uniref:PecA family PE domain-processing aspartic protease n=1 Tax=Mycobacterium sp. ITM-2016-00317 TaxID=2099694 RepID=UPI00287FC3A1|nr:PecA family PE domain-processing aspartic protease [Mycobacterium sp. ITM-2016-00317]WNG88982.1 PecA family PE domain-processing aspartic protease [Mycobacterium sp. ITM-2016-00317]